MKRTLYVGAAQIGVSGNVGENLDNILETIDASACQGIEVVVFPETCVSGYSPELGVQRRPQEWDNIQGAIETIQHRCAERGIWAVVGADTLMGSAWYNRAFAISSRGEIEAYYDKVHLTPGDVAYYTPGKNPAIFEINGIKVGLQICYDLRFPEGYRYLLDRGVQVIMQGFYGAGGDTWKVPVMGAHLVSRAAETGCFVVGCNVGNPLQIMRSAIIDPLGFALQIANQDNQEVIRAVLDMARIEDSSIRHDYMTRFRDLRLQEDAS